MKCCCPLLWSAIRSVALDRCYMGKSGSVLLHFQIALGGDAVRYHHRVLIQLNVVVGYILCLCALCDCLAIYEINGSYLLVCLVIQYCAVSYFTIGISYLNTMVR